MKTNKEKEKNSAQSYCSFLSSRTSDKGKVQVFNEETRILKQQSHVGAMRVLNVMTLCISTQFCLKTKRKSKELEEEKTPLFNVTWTLVLHFICVLSFKHSHLHPFDQQGHL